MHEICKIDLMVVRIEENDQGLALGWAVAIKAVDSDRVTIGNRRFESETAAQIEANKILSEISQALENNDITVRLEKDFAPIKH